MGDDRDIASFSLSHVLTLIAMIGAVFWLAAPNIKSSRPASEADVHDNCSKTNDVHARLWQDPLSAVWVAIKHGTLDPDIGLKAVQNEFKEHSGAPTLILPVMINGELNPENSEQRLRARVAVLSGLATSGFPPTKVERLNALTADLSPCSTPGSSGTKLTVPYEWCYANYGRHTATDASPALLRVLVLWLRDEDFRDLPLSTLDRLLCALKLPNDPQLRIKIIGPSISTTLRAMLIEAESNQLKQKKTNLKGVHIYATIPTVSDDALTYNIAWKLNRDPTMRIAKNTMEIQHPELEFHRYTPTDHQLMTKLSEELSLRRIDVKSPNTHVAIVSEWDTYYGRALPISFATAATDKPIDSLLEISSRRFDSPNQIPHPPWDRIHVFHYMRGLDGHLPAPPPPEPHGNQFKKSSTNDDDESISPEGHNQSDYLLRLAAQLEALDRELLHTRGVGLQAVGVLGSDVYDKLMVLRSLRPRLRHVTFFTNGLDAALSHSREWAATHNLVVVSPFGLQLDHHLQRQVPPFRDSYQTALFAATLHCLGILPESPASESPRLYEIGRTEAHDISTIEELPSRMHSPRKNAETWWNSQTVGKMALLFLALAYLLNHSQRVIRGEGERMSLIDSTWAFSALAISASVLCIWILAEIQYPSGEPFALLDGISVWPTNTLRLLAIFLAVHFLVKAQRRIQSNNREIAQEYRLTSPTTPVAISQTARKLHLYFARKRSRRFRRMHLFLASTMAFLHRGMGLRGRRANFTNRGASMNGNWNVYTYASDSSGMPQQGQRRVDVQKLWAQYVREGYVWHRFERVLPTTIAYFSFAILLLWSFGWPALPVRGAFAHFITVTLELVASFLSVMLTFYVVDATSLGTKFIRHFSKEMSLYPKNTYKQCNATRELDSDKLIAEYIDIRLIAEQTRALSPLIYYPFIIAFLMIVSRINYFDAWDWPIRLALVYCAILGYAIYSACRLRHYAETARSDALEKVKRQLFKHTTMGEQNRANAAREIMNEIQSIRDGAFAAFSKHPLLGAILLPSSGFSIWVLLQHLPHYQ